MKTIYLGLGSNLDDRLGNLARAIEALSPKVHVIEKSPIYETPPWGFIDQPSFLNLTLKAETAMEPLRLLKTLKKIESDLGRKPSVRWGPRRIDIDILFYDDLVFERYGLTIPHPRLHERAFVLVPLADIAPGMVHPVLGKTIRELLETTDRQGIKRYETRA